MGILFAIQAVGSVVWAVVLPQFKNTKVAYAVSLVIGGVGFALIPFLHDQYLQFIPFLMIGAGWAAMLAMPFTFVTNALQGYGHMGAKLVYEVANKTNDVAGDGTTTATNLVCFLIINALSFFSF